MAKRLLVGGFAVAYGHVIAAVLFAGASGRLAGFFAGCAIATALTAVGLHFLLRRSPPPEDDGEGGPGGPGGPGPGPGGPGGGGPDDGGSPPWWPEFEAAFRRYAAGGPRGARERARERLPAA